MRRRRHSGGCSQGTIVREISASSAAPCSLRNARPKGVSAFTIFPHHLCRSQISFRGGEAYQPDMAVLKQRSTMDVAYAGERAPDRILAVDVRGGEVILYCFGSGTQTLLCVSGGPGMPCDYVRDSHCVLAGDECAVIVYDQLGTGASSRPADASLWTLESYVEELESVRAALGLEGFHLLGQSWGVWIVIEYCLRFPGRVAGLVLANGCRTFPYI